MLNILVTAAGSPGFITVCKALKSSHFKKQGIVIHGCDLNQDAIGLNFADKIFKVPSGKSENYIDIILDYVSSNKIDVIIPCSDEELIPLSKNIKKIESLKCKVLVSPESSLDIVLDKEKLYRKIESLEDQVLKNIVPSYSTCQNFDDFIKAYKILMTLGHTVCVKPAVTHGSRGFRVITKTITQEQFFNQKPDPRKITYEEITKILKQNNGKFPELLVMQYLSGPEYSVDCLRDGKAFFCVPRKREVIKEGICTSGTAELNKELIEISRKIYDELNLKYNVNIQFKYDALGNPKILEINPRLSGTLELCRGAGINFVEIGVNNLLGIKNKSRKKIKWGTKMTRVWQEVFFDKDKIFTLNNINRIIPKKG